MNRFLSNLKKITSAQTKKEPKSENLPPDFSDEEIEIINFVKPYTTTGPERIFSLIEAMRYVIKNNVSGSIVECGVWKGGSIMAAAKTLLKLKNTEKNI